MLPSGSLLVLVNAQLSPLQLGVNDATGGWLGAVTVTLCDVAPTAPSPSFTLRPTVYVPPAA